MPRLCVVTDTPSKSAAIRRQVDGIFDLHCLAFDQIGTTEPPGDLLFDIDFRKGDRAAEVKAWLRRKPTDAKVILAIDKTSHLNSIQATALGATGILHRQYDRQAL